MASTAASRDLAALRVLIVEDEYFIADDMAKAIQRLGAQVIGPLPTVAEALALLASEPVDAAVLDINLKGQLVFPVADALRELSVPFVFATGYDESAVPEAYRDVPRWEKPFQPEDFAKVLTSTWAADLHRYNNLA